MFESVNIGIIRECGSKKYMEWLINNFFSISQVVNHCIESPSFSFCNEMWYIVIYPYGQTVTDSAGWVGIYLKKQYPTGLKENVSFKIGLKRLGETKYKSYKGTIASGGTLSWGTPKLCQQSDLKNEKSTLAPYDILTVFCTLRVNNNLFIHKTSSITEKLIGIERSLKFNPPTDTDTIMVNGVSTSIDTRLQCITGMKEFENKSLEELRLEDYSSDHQKTESLFPKYGSSGFLSDATILSFCKSNSIAENKFLQPADSNTTSKTEDSHPSFTFGSSSQESGTMDMTQIRATSGFNFGAPVPVTTSGFNFVTNVPVTASGFSFDTNMPVTTSSFSFGTPVPVSAYEFNFGTPVTVTSSFRSTEETYKNADGETKDSVTAESSAEESEESDTWGISENQTTSGVNFGSIPLETSRNVAAMNEDEIVQKTEQDFEMADYDKEKDVSEGLSKLSDDLKELYVKDKDTTMILKVQDKEFKVHRNILMARSPVFATMFEHDMVEKNYGLVEITDCDSDIFEVFLLYLYTGKAEKFSSDRVTRLYQVADKYDVQLLKSLCVKFMLQNLCVDNFCEILTLAVQFKESAILKSATNFFVKNVKNIVVTVNWLNFQKENPVEANELHIKVLNYILPS